MRVPIHLSENEKKFMNRLHELADEIKGIEKYSELHDFLMECHYGIRSDFIKLIVDIQNYSNLKFNSFEEFEKRIAAISAVYCLHYIANNSLNHSCNEISKWTKINGETLRSYFKGKARVDFEDSEFGEYVKTMIKQMIKLEDNKDAALECVSSILITYFDEDIYYP
jgi:hypothetical protein